MSLKKSIYVTILAMTIFLLLFAANNSAKCDAITLSDKETGVSALTGYKLNLDTVYKYTYTGFADSGAYKWFQFDTVLSGEYTIDFFNGESSNQNITASLISMYDIINELNWNELIKSGEGKSLKAYLQAGRTYFLFIRFSHGDDELTFTISSPKQQETQQGKVYLAPESFILLSSKNLGRNIKTAKRIETDRIYAIHDGDAKHTDSIYYHIRVDRDDHYLITLRSLERNKYFQLKLMTDTKTIQATDNVSLGYSAALSIEADLIAGVDYYLYSSSSNSNHDHIISICSSKHADPQIANMIKAPTCTQDGYSTILCAVCGHEAQRNTISATGHSASDPEIVNEATCDKEGYSVVRCLTCGETISRTIIPATGKHTPDNGSIVLSATCTEPGKKTYSCTICGKQLNEEVIPALGHQPSEEITLKAATCQYQGVAGVRCLVCNEILSTSPIPLGDHTPGEWTVIKEATCTEEGIQSRSCKVCGIDLEQETIVAKGHTFTDWTILQEASCTADGFKAHVCELCGETFDITAIPATGHHFGKWQIKKLPSTDEAGEQARVCDVCGIEETKELTLKQP